jgi:hypothetical protein
MYGLTISGGGLLDTQEASYLFRASGPSLHISTTIFMKYAILEQECIYMLIRTVIFNFSI